MAGVVVTQQPEMEDEVMNDVSLLSPDGPRFDSAFVSSPGDPMDISPMPTAIHQRQPVFQQQPSQTDSQAVEQSSHETSDKPPQPSFTNDHPVLNSAASYVKSDGNNKPSPGPQTRRTIFQPHRFSPKNHASLKQGHLKRLPLAVQAKLGTPHKPALIGMNRNFRTLPSSSNSHLLPHNTHATVNGYPSLGTNRLHDRPALDLPVNRQLFKPAAPLPSFTNAASNPATDKTAGGPTFEINPATSAVSDQVGSEAPRGVTGGSSLQRKRLNGEKLNDIDIGRPATYVSPKYRRLSQRGSDSASPAHKSQQEATAQDGSQSNLSQQPTIAPPTSSTLISSFKPNTSINKTRPTGRTENSKNTEAWQDMLELNNALQNQGIAPENPPHKDPSHENPKPSHRMPGSWPEDSLDFPEPSRDGPHLLTQDPNLSGDHGSLMPSTLVASPRSVSKTQQPVDSTSAPGSQAPSASAQAAETPQGHSLEAGQAEQAKDQPSFSWSEQLHRIYTHSWGATQSVVATAIALADTFKRRAVALFEEPRTSRTSHTAPSSSPTRANLRMLPEEQRRRLKSNQWRIDRGFPTVQDYPFPELSLDAPQFLAATDSLPEDGSHPKPVTPDVKRSISRDEPFRKPGAPPAADAKRLSTKSGINKRSTFQSLSPNMKRRMHMRPAKRNIARARLDRSLVHAVDSGKWSLEDLPTKLKGRVAPVKDHKRLARPELVKTQEEHLLKSILRRAECAPTEAARQKRAAPKKVRFVLQSAPPDDDPALVGHYLHPGLTKIFIEEQNENEPPKQVVKEKPEVPDPDLRSWLQSDFPFGKPVSAVRLFTPGAKSLPPGRTESIYAAEWRKIEEEKRSQVPARIRPEGPAVRPLPPKWEARLAEVKMSPDNRQIATTLSGDPLTKRALATCWTPMAWLNDEVINAYLAVLIDYLRRINGNAGRHDKPKFHAFNSFFFSNLRDKGYSSVSRWAKRAKIGGEALLEVDTVYIPVHNSAHWTLMVVKPSERSIEYFDSLGSASPRHVAIVKDWLRGELAARYVEEEWSVVPTVSPQQDNGSDCGVFLLSTAKAVAIGIEPQSYGAKDIPLLRRKIVAELMAGGLDGDFNPKGETGEVLM